MTEPDQLRQEAARALRLSQLIGDKLASEALVAHAANLFERADAMERERMERERGPVPQPPAAPQQPGQQRQEVQSKKLDDLADC